MGKCPSFVLRVEADGKAHYLGRRFAHYDGEKQLQLAPDVLATVEQLAKQMNFDVLPEDEFGHGMMDAPSAIVTLRREYGVRSVRCTGRECPQELLDLHRYLDRVLAEAFSTTLPEGE